MEGRLGGGCLTDGRRDGSLFPSSVWKQYFFPRLGVGLRDGLSQAPIW